MGHPWIWWILVGLVAGILAKALTPGSTKEPRGCIMTILLGIAGALITGFIMRALHLQGSGGTMGTIIGATLGAVLLILLLRKVWV